MRVIDRLRSAINEICSTAEMRNRDIANLCRELRQDIDVYERLIRYRESRARERKGGGEEGKE